jgi:hypothetical protein
MVHSKDYHRNIFQKLFGGGKRITAIASFTDGDLKKLDATIDDADSSPSGSRNQNFKYEKLAGGEESYAAPRHISEWSEMVEVGRSKTGSYHREVEHFNIDYIPPFKSPPTALSSSTFIRPSLPRRVSEDDTSGRVRSEVYRLARRV